MIAIVLGPALSLAGVVIAYRGWRDRSRAAMVLAALLWATSMAAWVRGFGAEIGIALALETAALIAFVFILTRIERRTVREAKDRVAEPLLPAPGHRLRGVVRAATAGPIGLVAALGIGVAFALTAPLVEQTRLILAGLIVPSLWAGAIVWTLASTRPGVAALWLAAAGGAGFAIAFLPQG
jgi:hypothetical protein